MNPDEIKKEAEDVLFAVDEVSRRVVSQVNRFLLPEIRERVAGIARGDMSQAVELKRIIYDASIPENSNSDNDIFMMEVAVNGQTHIFDSIINGLIKKTVELSGPQPPLENM